MLDSTISSRAIEQKIAFFISKPYAKFLEQLNRKPCEGSSAQQRPMARNSDCHSTPSLIALVAKFQSSYYSFFARLNVLCEQAAPSSQTNYPAQKMIVTTAFAFCLALSSWEASTAHSKDPYRLALSQLAHGRGKGTVLGSVTIDGRPWAGGVVVIRQAHSHLK